jgi:adenylate kinase
MGRKIVILLGQPGAGKGTQSRAVMRQLNIPQISTGDMLRDAVTRQTALGKEAKEKMDAGDLVSDEIVNGIVAERIALEDCSKGFILDGYPRNAQQAETFRHLMQPGDQLFVIEIGTELTQLVDRVVGRLMCPNCGDIYNIYSNLPKNDKVCDRCGFALVHRSDDREDLIKGRQRTYKGETFPLMDFYRKMGVLHRVDGMRPIPEVTKDILAILDGDQALTPTPNGGNQKFA